MLSERDVERCCDARSFQRARALASSSKNILTKQVRYNDDETVLSAFVASSSGWNDRYRTSVFVDEDEGAVLDYVCTCPAFRERDGMCKHCAALALSYCEAPQAFMGYRERREPATSACIADFMRRARNIEADEACGGIEMETVLAYGYRTWSARFKLAGPHGSYVVKNVSGFVERMRAKERFTYGKHLSFVHSPAALTDHANAVARFLDKAVALREQAAGPAFARPQGRSDVGRDLDLSEAELIELLDLLEGRTFRVEGTDRRTRSVTHASVRRADPSLHVGLREAEHGGYLVACEDDAVFAAWGQRMYVWQDDVFYRCSPAFAACADFLRNVYDSDESRLFVARRDMPLFCATVLPAIERHLLVDAPASVQAWRPVPCELAFYFDKTAEGVQCATHAVYGAKRYPLCGEDADAGRATDCATGGTGSDATGASSAPEPLRDERTERKAELLVERYFGWGDAVIPLADDERIANLLFGGIAEFRSLGDVFTTPAFDRLIRDGKPRVTVGVSLSGDLVNLTVSSEDLPARELSALLASYRRRKRYHRLRTGAFLSLQDLDLSQLDRLASDLGITAKQLASGAAELPAYRALYLDEEKDLDRDRSFDRYVEGFRAVCETDYRIPRELAGTLRPYQAEGFRWLSARCDAGFSGILADEMGLGKSVQVIALLQARRAEARAVGPSLVVCPASLVYNWLAEFERFAPRMRVRAVAGSKRERARIRAAAFDANPCDALVTSYDLLRIDAADYARLSFFCCVLDEAHYIKNPAALITRAAKRVRARHRFALTGTPMENRLSELWSIFDFLMPGLLGPYARFHERFELPIVGGDEDAARRLQSLVGPFMLRRLKADVLKELPDKLESTVYAPLEGEQRRLYAAHEQRLREELTEQRNDKNRGKDKVQILAELTKLRQLCCDPGLLYEDYRGGAAKLDAIADLVASAMDAGEKTIVFSQFASFLSRIADRLDEQGVPFFSITGATPKRKRLELVNAFNEDDTPVFLVSLKAGGTGLNLTGASVVIHADPWWNAAAQNQATDRAHRIGQSRVVSVHKVIAQGTIEERIVRLQDAKSELAGRIVGSSGTSLSSLTKEDLIDLLRS